MIAGKIIKSSLLLLFGLLFLAAVVVFIPGVQKKLLETQLAPYVSEVSVDYIAVNPFSARIDELNLKQDELSVHIGHFEGQYSLFNLLLGRLKINKLVLDNTLIEDYSESESDDSPSPIPLFPGVFPYLNHGLIYDIGHLSLDAGYVSPASGKINITVNGDNINELTDNALLLQTDISDVGSLPDLDHININGTLYLNQHLKQAIDAQTTKLKITFQEVHSTPQFINIDLKMAALDEAPDTWDEFYFSDQHKRYIGELVNPESIDLKIRQTNSQERTLSAVDFKGHYNGNSGIIQGLIKVKTDKDFLQVINSMQLPLIESDIAADFAYSLITLDGRINLEDTVSIENLKYQSLPEKFHIKNQLTAEINNHHLTVNQLELALTENEHPYLQLSTLQSLDINLNNLPAFFEKHNNEIADLSISELPLSWFSDFLPDYTLQSGELSTALSLAVENKYIKARTTSPITINALTVLQTNSGSSADIPQSEQTQTQDTPGSPVKEQRQTSQAAEAEEVAAAPEQAEKTQSDKAEEEQAATDKVIVDTLNLSSNLLLNTNADRLQLNLPDFTLTQGNSEQLHTLLKNSVDVEVNKLLNQDIENKPFKLDTRGDIHINETLNLPIVRDSFNQPVPESLALNYTLKLNGSSPDWTIEELQTTLSQNYSQNFPEKESKNLLLLLAKQPIKLSQSQDSIELHTQGDLLTGYLKHINLAWASPYIEDMDISGTLNEMNFSVSSAGNNDFSLDVPDISIYNLSATETGQQGLSQLDKAQQDKAQLDKATEGKDQQENSQQENKVLFDKLNLSSQLNVKYTPDVIAIVYPKLTLDQGKAGLIRNNGSVVISDYTEPEQQLLIAQGTLNGFVHNIMSLGYVQALAKQKLKAKSLLDAQYQLEMSASTLNIKKSNFNLHHPETSGKLTINTIKPVSFALGSAEDQSNPTYKFSPDGHLRVTLKNFDSKPYENFLAEQAIAFDHINGQLDIWQKNNRQEVIFKKPLKVSNFHFKDPETRPLEPFDLELNLQISQNKNLLSGEVKKLSLQFLDQQEKALDTHIKFKLDLNRGIPVRSLEGKLNAILTQWLEQPAAIPENTLQQGTLDTEFKVDKKGNIKHFWQINDLIDEQNQQIVKSMTIDGTGQLHSASDIELDLPITMDSQSGQTYAQVKTQINLNKSKSLNLDINGKTVYLNDIFKLLDAISPPEKVAEAEPEQKSETETEQTKPKQPPINTVVDTEPFWKSAIDIDASLSIDKLYQTDYLAFDQITGKLSINDNEFKAHDISALFHDSPLKLDSIINFKPAANLPYDVDFTLEIKDFNLEDYLHELDPEHEARIAGIFNVDFKAFGGMDNIEQFRNQLLFDSRLVSYDGIYHFIPKNSVLLLSASHAMAITGEVVSLVPTAGFGLGIMPRLVRFIKDFPYDKIDIHLVRNPDKNTTIEQFEIFSPLLYMHASGGITFVENKRLFDSPLQMTAKLDLAGEGAAIFYGLNLLSGEKNEYGFWRGPEIIFGGTVNNPTDNFEEIIETAKKGTVQGGFTRPFSGIIGDFKYRWFAPKPDYQDAVIDVPSVSKNKSVTVDKQSVETPSSLTDKQKIKDDKTTSAQTGKKPKAPVKPKPVKKSFFDETFE